MIGSYTGTIERDQIKELALLANAAFQPPNGREQQ